jgi:hypothetical protein
MLRLTAKMSNATIERESFAAISRIESLDNTDPQPPREGRGAIGAVVGDDQDLIALNELLSDGTNGGFEASFFIVRRNDHRHPGPRATSIAALAERRHQRNNALGAQHRNRREAHQRQDEQ